MQKPNEPDYQRLFVAIFFAIVLLVGWQALVEWPRRQHLAQYNAEKSRHVIEQQAKQAAAAPVKDSDSEDDAALTRAQRLALSPRVAIVSDKLNGSIALKGARFDDLMLAKYRETLDADSPEVTLFSPNGDEDAYFAQIGWVSPDQSAAVPDQKSLWKADNNRLTPNVPVHLRWDNGAGVTFVLTVALDDNYMFTIGQEVENHSGHAISVSPYAYINRQYDDTPDKQDARYGQTKLGLSHYNKTASSPVIHEGPLGVMSSALEEIDYKALREKGNQTFDDASGWFGITDKYWQSSIIPGSGHYKNTFSHYIKSGNHRYQADYLAQPEAVAAGATQSGNVRLFAGAKELTVLDRYTSGDAAHNEPPILLFDRSVDFGVLYFLTKPMFILLTFFHSITGNFGVAIILLTIVVRMLLYPLANKSYKATAQMRALQPEMLKIRERFADDQIALNKEMLQLYKQKKINPASGCLPVLLQMPVFFALYKVFYVTIEMRHAPFLGWIRDLSAADPANIFTAFGLVPWSAPAWLHLGILPMLMCATMVIQMKQQPKPADPIQAKMMNYMPYFFLFIFSKMPAGLVLYWTCSNLISILQQRVIGMRNVINPGQ